MADLLKVNANQGGNDEKEDPDDLDGCIAVGLDSGCHLGPTVQRPGVGINYIEWIP